ncbi:MAG: dihydroxy-acid dehydratase [Synergistaceae bacterium]|nr:dihydroxy-acid dehydratase [Synergistaceae bacterium]
MGASTNSTLHIPAIAHEANLDVTLADFDEAGGIPALLKAIESKLDTHVMTVTGKTLGENLKDVELVENDAIFPLSSPKKPEGGLAILHGNLSLNGGSV